MAKDFDFHIKHGKNLELYEKNGCVFYTSGRTNPCDLGGGSCGAMLDRCTMPNDPTVIDYKDLIIRESDEFCRALEEHVDAIEKHFHPVPIKLEIDEQAE
jgi:hypothetical protein